METGSIIEFIEGRRFMAAVVTRVKGSKVLALGENDREMNIAASRILHTTPGGVKTELSRDQQLKILRGVAQRRQTLAEQIDLVELWELLEGEGAEFDYGFLAELVWPDEAGADHRAAVMRAVFEDGLRFKMKPDAALRHDAEKVEQIMEARTREEKLERELDEGGAWLESVWTEGWAEEPECRDRVVRIMRDMAIFGTDASEYKRGKQLLDRAGLTGGQTRPFEILVKLGEMGVHENLDLSREGVSVSFSSEALAEADDLAKASAPGSGRRDLSHLDLITVDSGGARDFDDAVSLEPIEAGFRLGVHIADVSSVIHPDTVLDLEARYRATSIYMPDRRIPMLPEILSEERLSLKEGEPRPAFSMTADLSPDGEVLDYTFFSSLVRVNRQLSYQEVDAGYQNDLVLSRMFDLSEALKRRRTETGALLLPLPKLNVYLTPDGEIGVNLTDWENPGRSMIGEFMILANYLAARLLTERGAPCYYRHQPSPSQVLIDGQTDRSNLYLCLQQRQFLQRVDWGLKPKAHAGMGLDVYTNLTSPLRRYIDLVIQRQVRSVVDSGEPLYSAEDLSELLTTTEAARRKAFRVQNRRRRYWLMRYFEQMPERTFQALVLNKLPHRWRLFIPEFMLDIDLPDKPPLKLEPGQKIDVRIKKVDAREEIFRFVPV